ncbi:hypothetical protein FV242_21405 [Methylobacterium sp. WL64]|uniref:hypothetical protein n=1 Tax=Methylobacterium sp. WL64 TaxID=2603894 RepID=UPI0011CB0E97|nr:hypothetical protein [Methylobacterium sp. WL64]TXN00632.1 hypothetical protein FV242_21405 [Methylobacterium sp. WL64]
MKMRFNYAIRFVFTISMAPIIFSEPAVSRERIFVESVDGWETNKTIRENDPSPCQITHSYLDMTDDGSENSIGITRLAGQIIFMISYEKWNWPEGESFKSDLVIADEPIDPTPIWIGKEKVIYCRIPNREITKLSLGRIVIVRFPEGDADFDVSGVKNAIAAMDDCNRLSASK